MADHEVLEAEVKEVIIDLLGREDLRDIIHSDVRLSGEAVGLDSLDIIELVQAIEARYDINMDISDSVAREALGTIHGIAKYITAASQPGDPST
ncbi:MAG TPA: phosphopantetheine-binding protein [Streptosporangiaceae bacterium]|nr:phosphopantetheine-binding protein [Streptosporangiaceae bacterium]